MHKIQQLAHSFGTIETFKDVNLTIEQGEVISLLGRSGCGKSTLLRCIAGLEKPIRGEIIIDDTVVFSQHTTVGPGNRNVGLVFQDYALFPSLSVEDNVGFGVDDQAQVKELMKLVGIDDLAQRLPHQLSGGQQQRASLARALAPQPKLLLLDEPFSNIDAHRKLELSQEIRRIVEHQGISAVFVTHDQADAFTLADRVAVMVHNESGGTIAQVDTPQDIYNHPINPEVARISGASIFLEGTIRTDGFADTILGLIPVKECNEGKVNVLIRTENLQFVPSVDGPTSITMSYCTGPSFQLVIDVNGTRFRVPHSTFLAKGTTGKIEIIAPCLCW